MSQDKLVDLHCHILPGLDDGSPDLEHSLNLAREAVADGVTHILATPHHLDNEYVNHATDVVKAATDFQAQLDARGIELAVFPGQEVHINGDLLQRYDDLLGIDENKHYMLLEFPHGEVPGYAKRLIFDLRKVGTTPVIVHPERNRGFQKNLDLLYDFISEGALAQLTATSYLGGFGSRVQEISEQLVAHNLVQIMASDAHTLKGRKFVLGEAFDKLTKKMGSEVAQQFELNAENLINGQRVVAQDFTRPSQGSISQRKERKKKRFFFF